MVSLSYACEIADDDEDEDACDGAEESEPVADLEDDVDDDDDDAVDGGEEDDDAEPAANDGGADVVAAQQASATDRQSSNQQRHSSSSSSSDTSRPEWATVYTSIVVPGRPRRLPETPPTPTHLTPLQLLQQFITTTLVDSWATYTNTYHRLLTQDELSTTTSELYAFIAAHIFMGIVRLPQLPMYWQPETTQSFIASLFTRDRFLQLMRCFCITNPTTEAVIDDVVLHTASFFAHLNDVFPLYFAAGRSLVIDESIVAYTGRDPRKQYMAHKPHPFGYKVFTLASLHYCRRMELYPGAAAREAGSSSTHDLCVRLLHGYENKNHILFTDSWFTSPALLQSLAAVDIAICGSVRHNRKGMPPSTQLSSSILHQLPRTQTLYFQRNNMCVTAWKDKKPICVLYNHKHPSSDLVTLHRRCKHGGHYDVKAPAPVAAYFKYMRSVDVINQLRYTYPIGRKGKRARWRLVWWLIDMCIVNAYTIWTVDRQDANQLDFRTKLMNELAEARHNESRAAVERVAIMRGAMLAKDHYPSRSGEERDCALCSRRPQNRKQSRVVCSACKVHLCIGECFRLYHS
jgi:hypothetical protein